MNWDAIGAIGQILGALAVFITLVYLAIQIRQVRRQMRLSANQARWDALREIMLARIHNSEFSEAEARIAKAHESDRLGSLPFQKLVVERYGATLGEANQLNSLFWAFWFYREQGILFRDELEPGQRAQFEAAISGGLRSGTLESAWYEMQKMRLNPEAVRYIDDVMAASEGAQ